MSILGLRNLVKKAKEPIIILKLTYGPYKKKKATIKKVFKDFMKSDLKTDETVSPNFGFIT